MKINKKSARTIKEATEQVRRFKETARQLGADEDEAAFREKLGVIARQKAKAPANPVGVVKKPVR